MHLERWLAESCFWLHVCGDEFVSVTYGFGGFPVFTVFVNYDQGFRKVHPDRWEFANEGFLRGQKHLLKTIKRRKTIQGPVQHQVDQTQVQAPSSNACVEVGKFGLEEEVEMLKRDKNVLMQELVKLRQQQQSTDKQLQVTMDRLQGMEQRQQQLMSFLAKAMQSPGFLTQFVQQQAQNSRIMSEANKKRRLKEDDILMDGPTNIPEGQIVKYQPFLNDMTTFIRQMMEAGTSSQIDFGNNDQGNFLFRDASDFNGQQGSSSLDSVSNPSTSEVQASSMEFSSTPASLIPLPGFTANLVDLQPSRVTSGSKVGSVVQYPLTSSNVAEHDNRLSSDIQSEHDVSLLPNMVPQSIVENSNVDSVQLDPFTFGSDIVLPFDIENIPLDDETTDVSAYDDVWNLLFEEDSPQVGDTVRERDMLLLELDNDASDHNQNIDHLTDQMELLSSSALKSDEMDALIQHHKV